jgi:hypothetical protein
LFEISVIYVLASKQDTLLRSHRKQVVKLFFYVSVFGVKGGYQFPESNPVLTKCGKALTEMF